LPEPLEALLMSTDHLEQQNQQVSSKGSRRKDGRVTMRTLERYGKLETDILKYAKIGPYRPYLAD